MRDAIFVRVGDPDPTEPDTHRGAPFRYVVRGGDLDGFRIGPNEHAPGTVVSVGDRPDAALAGPDARLSLGGNVDGHKLGELAGLRVDACDPSLLARRRPHGTEPRIHPSARRLRH